MTAHVLQIQGVHSRTQCAPLTLNTLAVSLNNTNCIGCCGSSISDIQVAACMCSQCALNFTTRQDTIVSRYHTVLSEDSLVYLLGGLSIVCEEAMFVISFGCCTCRYDIFSVVSSKYIDQYIFSTHCYVHMCGRFCLLLSEMIISIGIPQIDMCRYAGLCR